MINEMKDRKIDAKTLQKKLKTKIARMFILYSFI